MSAAARTLNIKRCLIGGGFFGSDRSLPQARTDVSGNLQTRYTYGPFGNTALTGAASDNPYQYGGREADPLTGMYYLRGRFLDSGLSRFVSRDPAGFQSGGHLYNYAGNAPTMGIDPTGEDVYQAGYVVGFSYGYILGFAYGVEAFVDPTTANTLTAEGFTTASDVGFGATAYSALSSDSLSTSSTIGLAACRSGNMFRGLVA
jgi:RHS repeat-associated protein